MENAFTVFSDDPIYRPVLVINWIERAQDQVKTSKIQWDLSKPCDLAGM